MTGEPEKKFAAGMIRATVWKNTAKNGNEFKSISVTKSYQKDGEWKNSNSFGAQDLDKAIQVLQEAKSYLNGAVEEEIVL